MSQFESKVTIEVTKDKKVVQLSGDYEFIESFLPKVMGTYADLEMPSRDNPAKAFNENEGYLSETVEIKHNDNQDTSHYHTGIKVGDDGINRYRCRYECSQCENKGTRYIKSGQPIVHCHECNNVMEVESVADDESVKDTFNNFYKAGVYEPRF